MRRWHGEETTRRNMTHVEIMAGIWVRDNDEEIGKVDSLAGKKE